MWMLLPSRRGLHKGVAPTVPLRELTSHGERLNTAWQELFRKVFRQCNHILLCGTCYPSGPKLTRQKRNLYTTVPVGRQILVLQCYGQFEFRFSDVCHGLRRHSTHRKRAMHVHHEIHLSLIELFSVKKSASFGSRRHN